MQYGHYPAPRFTIAHLSDVHLLAHGVRQYGVIEPEDGLNLALERLRRLERVPDALVFTGDLADKAEPEAYARLRGLVEPVAAEMGAVHLELAGLPGAKAGKINAALERTSEEFILVLDPDHYPMPPFLERVLGHFDDARVGFVQVAQNYYDPDRIVLSLLPLAMRMAGPKEAL